MISKAKLYWKTLRHLRISQIFYLLYYRLQNKFRISSPFKPIANLTVYPIVFHEASKSLGAYQFDNQGHVFNFLNTKKTFEKIDWEFLGFGKLWLYNLNYFDYLLDSEIDPNRGLWLIQDYTSKLSSASIGMEPFPISVRGINWIVFLSKNGFTDIDNINSSIQYQYNALSNRLEYHLLGNHLLENGFSLLFGAFYLKNNSYWKLSKRLVSDQLREQILNDGGHFERSPMYHQLVLTRLLDCINLLQNNHHFGDAEFLEELCNYAIRMMSWLEQVTFRDGSVPQVNDSILNVGPETNAIMAYAKRLNLRVGETVPLSDSGYQIHNIEIRGRFLEIFMDVGPIGPDYQPGHAHSDTLNFLISIDDKPVIVDTGTSTYENGKRRIFERSTEAHNTVKYGPHNQSQVWSAFRVGSRARATILENSENILVASHDGYKSMNIVHKRTFEFEKSIIQIKDEVLGDRKFSSSTFIHFHPDVIPSLMGEVLTLHNTGIKISFFNYQSIELISYDYAQGYNKLEQAFMIEAVFDDWSRFVIELTP